MAIDNAIYIGEMDTDSPLNSDPRAEGAGQMRAIKRAVQNSFPNINGEVTATETELSAIGPVAQVFQYGFVSQWFGAYNPDNTPLEGEWFGLPEGWAALDGRTWSNVIGQASDRILPDLRGRFTKGFDPDVDTESERFGGSNSIPSEDIAAVLETDGHVLTVEQIPPHSHDFRGVPEGATDNQGAGSSSCADAKWNTLSTVSTGGGQAHEHGVSGVADATVDVVPEYYAIVYITYVGVDAIPVTNLP